MIIDHRTYSVIPGKLPEFLKVYKELGFETQSKHLGNLLGFFTSMDIGELNQVVHMWGYESLQDRADRRAQLAADPNWGAYLAAAMPLLQKMENKILNPTDFSPIK